jgi:hypothetical protein
MSADVRRRPPISSRICFLGYTIGYIVLEAEFPALFKSLAPMDSKSRFVTRDHLVDAELKNSSAGIVLRAHSGVLGTPPARGARAGGTGTARGLGTIVRCDGICDRRVEATWARSRRFSYRVGMM